ncbi:hypothetical protein EKO27_g4054 [Xylaria grammica]|uniref:Uncharacterized protein n=1 Tax=Xylaria grammica TaxID=363999 RepID=A0A439D9H1_9PEZI|nr:hypothetical protein EKO27_g4054 [Xylaria grammica]
MSTPSPRNRKVTLLWAFFRSMALSITGENVDFSDEGLEEELRSSLCSFADYPLDNFFLPCLYHDPSKSPNSGNVSLAKASTKRTPQPPPAYHSAFQEGQRGANSLLGGRNGYRAFVLPCLISDRHRCVMSRRFGQQEALKCMKDDRNGAKDDDGNLLVSPPRFGKLEVAHILLRSLTRFGSGSELDSAIAILNMLDGGVGHLIQGTDIDQPRNALTLTADLPHTYEIDSFVAPNVFQDGLPIARTLYLTPTRTMDPPSPRLLATHRAIAHTLHLSDAGEYIEKTLQDVEEIGIRADGSTELGCLVKPGLGGRVRA